MRDRIYYRIVLELTSALSIGAMHSSQTDRDVVLDSRGWPLLPATSLAGLYRSHVDELKGMEIFGEAAWKSRKDIKDRLAEGPEPDRAKLVPGEKDHRWDESAVKIYDGELYDENAHGREWAGGNQVVSVRDSVALKDKVAIDKLKFDRQAVQAGARFVTYIEVTDTSRCHAEDVEDMLSAVHSGELRLGSKKTRGLGRLEVLCCLRRSFGTGDLRDWLVFDMFRCPTTEDKRSGSYKLSGCWKKAEDITKRIKVGSSAPGVEIRLTLKLRGGASVREYTTEPSSEEEVKPDYGQMIIHGVQGEGGDDVPVIPGTSWAGAFRERYERFVGKERTRELFGFVDPGCGKGSTRMSRIRFDESVLKGGEWKTITRNAIDRFTGGTIDRALYTDRCYFGGSTELVMRVDSSISLDEGYVVPLVCTLADLHNGFLAVGGLTSVGRGLFKISSAELRIDGTPRKGFEKALLAKLEDEKAKGRDLIEPKAIGIAKLVCGKEGECGE